MTHTTDIQAGDRFRFHGLTGQRPEDWPAIGDVVEVQGVGPTGELQVVLRATDGGTHPTRRVGYIDALALIEQGIWQALV